MKDANQKKQMKSIERVTISDALKEKLSSLSDQATKALNGMASITKSDIVNLLIEEQKDDLSNLQIEKLKARHLDQVKYAYWIANQLKEARNNGESLTLEDLMTKNQNFIGNLSKRKKTRKKSQVKVDDGSHLETIDSKM